METIRLGRGPFPKFDSKITSAKHVYERNNFSQTPKVLIAVKDARGSIYRLIAANDRHEFTQAMEILLGIGMIDELRTKPKTLWGKAVRFLRYAGYSFVFCMSVETRMMEDSRFPLDLLVDMHTTESEHAEGER